MKKPDPVGQPSRSRYLIESFGPELLELLKRGARGRVEISKDRDGNLIPYRRIHYLRMRLSNLRGVIRRNDHELKKIVSRCGMQVLWGERAGYPPVEDHIGKRNNRRPKDTMTPAKLILQPNDAQFEDLLDPLNLSINQLEPSHDLPQPLSGEKSAQPSSPRNAFDAFLDDVG